MVYVLMMLPVSAPLGNTQSMLTETTPPTCCSETWRLSSLRRQATEEVISSFGPRDVEDSPPLPVFWVCLHLHPENPPMGLAWPQATLES